MRLPTGGVAIALVLWALHPARAGREVAAGLPGQTTPASRDACA